MDDVKLDFLESIFLLNNLPKYYKSLNCSISEKFYYNNSDDPFPKVDDNIVIVKDVPRYINTKVKCTPKGIKQLNIEYYSGLSINLNGVNSVESYLKAQFGNSSRYKLRRSIKKLEKSFDITYQMYFGNISREEYNLIFDEFFRLLAARSNEKGIKDNRHLEKKDCYYKLVLPLILQKKASLFVIYNNKKPIDVCLNFHAGTIIFQLIRTYDINYSKFNPGYIDLIKQIEWSLINKIEFITFSYGKFYWKKRWCNSSYKYDYTIFYNKNSVKSIFKVFTNVLNLKSRHILREKGLIDKFHEKKLKFYNFINPSKKTEIEVDNIDFNTHFDIEFEINIYKKEYTFLIKTAYDFLFNFNEREKDIRAYKIDKDQNKYLIAGKKNKILVTID